MFAVCTLLLALFSCSRAPQAVTKPEEAMAPLSWWKSVAPADDTEFKDAAAAARQSLEYYKKLSPDSVLQFGPEQVSAADMVNTLQSFLSLVEDGALQNAEKLKRIKTEFVFHRSVGSDGRGKVLFTGYYEPMLSCRTAQDAKFPFPLYKRPDDIIEVDLTQFGTGFPKNKIYGKLDKKKIVPYYSRQEIDRKNALANRGLELLWCADLVDIAVLHVQGSGKADLGNGTIVSVLYDGANGRPYKSIGKHLIDTGALTKEAMSMQAIREYLRSHPDTMNDILDQNPSYVFFRLDRGPSLGNIGVPLTPGRSIATDSRLFPRGALAFIAAQKPVIENNAIREWVPFSRFVLNQDTGGAIKGPGRVDVFFGQGAEAELTAGNLQHEGELYFLVKKK